MGALDKLVENVSFGFSFYKYLYEDYKLPDDYDPTGFIDPSGFDPWKEVRSLKKSPTETFNEYLKLSTTPSECDQVN